MSAQAPQHSIRSAVKLSRGMLIATAAMASSALVGVLLGAYLHEVSAASTVSFTPAELQSPQIETTSPQMHATVHTKVVTVIQTVERQVPVAIAEREPLTVTRAPEPVTETTTVEKPAAPMTTTRTSPPTPTATPTNEPLLPRPSRQSKPTHSCSDLLDCLLRG